MAVDADSATAGPSTRRIWATGLVAVLAVAGALGAIVAGCGAAAYDSCEVDSDCGNNEICANEQCAPECNSDEDCDRSGFTCQPFYEQNRDDSTYICQERDTGTEPDGEGACSSDEDCRERVETGEGEEAFCDPFGDCRVGDIIHGVAIEDVTAASDENLDGSEIAAVFVIGPNEDVVGYGETVEYAPVRSDAASDTGVGSMGAGGGTADSGHADGTSGDTGPADTGVADTGISDATVDASDDAGPSILYRSTIDGTPPNLDGNECIDGPKRRTTPLGGEPGRLVVEFVDRSGNPLLVDSDDRIVVIEWGTNCDAADDEDDRFTVSFCKSARSRIVPDNDCGRALADGAELQGYNPLEPTGVDGGGDR